MNQFSFAFWNLFKVRTTGTEVQETENENSPSAICEAIYYQNCEKSLIIVLQYLNVVGLVQCFT